MSKAGWWVVATMAACVQPTQPSYYGGQQQGQPPQQQQPYAQAQPTLSGCTALVSCLEGCAQDGTCGQSCLAQSDQTSQQQLRALMECNESRCQGQSSDCMDTQCSYELAQCRGTTQVTQAPQQPAYEAPAPQEVMKPGQPHTTANLLPWLQQGDGDWIGTNNQFTFYKDGRVRRSTSTPMYTDKGVYGCVSRINEEGTVRQEGDVLIMDFGPQDQNHCGSKDTGPAMTIRYKIEWYQYSDGPVNLLLVDLGCDRPMYCNNQMRKR